MVDIDLAMDVKFSEDEDESPLRTEEGLSVRKGNNEGHGRYGLTKLNASEFSELKLMEELNLRKLRLTGLRDQDVTMLQRALDSEYEEREKKVIKEERVAEQARMQRRHEFLEKQAAEEKNGLLENPEAMFWFDLIRQNTTEKMAKIHITNITLRPLTRAMCSNTSLVDLDVSHNGLDDMAGSYLANCLRHNKTILKLSMGHNNFAARTCKSLSMSMLENKTLIHLGLESNPLSSSSAERLGAILQTKCRLLSLSLWRCGLGVEGGKRLIEGLDQNDTLISMEVGYNGLSKNQECTIAMKLSKNSNDHHCAEVSIRAEQLESNRALRQKKFEANAIRKETEMMNWLEKQKVNRAKNRIHTAEIRCSVEAAARESWLVNVCTRPTLQEKKPKK